MSIDDHTDLPVELRHEGPARTLNVTGIQLDAYREYRNQSQPADSGGGQSGFSLRDILYTLFRHKKKIVFMFLACSIGGVLFVAFSPNFYASEAKILIRGDKTSLRFEAAGSKDGGVVSSAPSNTGMGTDAIRTNMAVFG